MKEIKFAIEFTSHVLANSTNVKGQQDVFQRDGQDNLIFQSAWWYSAFTKAIELARTRGIKASDISMDLTVKAPTQIFNRKYSGDQFREHESIMPGTVVTFNGMVSDSITESVLRNILEKLVTYVGLSPYGFLLGFGRGVLKSLTVEPSDASNLVR